MTAPLPPSNARVGRATLLATVLLVAAAAFVPAPTAASPSDGAVTVELDADGSATLTVTYAFDLAGDEREAFEALREDGDARADARERSETRMASVAADATAETGREMHVSEATIDATVEDGVGFVHLSVEWSNLAAVEDGRLILSEPFASGYRTDRPVTVHVPEGYTIESADPAPDDGDRTRATWNAGTDFGGFELVAGEGGTNGADADQPGFGVLAACVAMGAALLARRR